MYQLVKMVALVLIQSVSVVKGFMKETTVKQVRRFKDNLRTFTIICLTSDRLTPLSQRAQLKTFSFRYYLLS